MDKERFYIVRKDDLDQIAGLEGQEEYEAAAFLASMGEQERTEMAVIRGVVIHPHMEWNLKATR